MALNFPNSPTEGDTYTAEGVTWVYRGGRWVITQPAAPGPTGAITIGPLFPANPATGDLHMMTDGDTGLFVWYDDGSSQQWIQSNGLQNEPVPEPEPEIVSNINIINMAYGRNSSDFSGTSTTAYNVPGAFFYYHPLRADSYVSVEALFYSRGDTASQDDAGFYSKARYYNGATYADMDGPWGANSSINRINGTQATAPDMSWSLPGHTWLFPPGHPGRYISPGHNDLETILTRIYFYTPYAGTATMYDSYWKYTEFMVQDTRWMDMDDPSNPPMPPLIIP